MLKRNVIWSTMIMFVIVSLLVGACAQATPAPTTEAPAAPAATEAPAAPAATEAPVMTEAPAATTAPAATEAPAAPPTKPTFPVKAGGELEKALTGAYKGKTVTVDGPFTAPDDERFRESMKVFEDATGITVNYIGDKNFESRISIAVDAGNAPDIADFPQPGAVANFARQGKIVAPTTWISEDWLKQQYNQSWLDMAMVADASGTPMSGGVWHRFNGKSLVWYPKAAWDEAGYKIPTTWDELMTLTQQIADDGDTAWCIGIGSQAATGWPATDWTEELMLRTTSLENYDKWVKGELKFDSPEVKNAIETWSKIWFNDKYVYGGRDKIVSTYFGDAPLPMFEKPPKCWLHRQGNFITSFFPQGLVAGTDYDFFYLPGIDAQYGSPYLIAGDIYGMFNDRPEVRAVMEYFTRAESLKSWMQAGGALSPHNDQDLSWYGDPMEKKIADLVQKATTVRFDGSDQMPSTVGQGTFWKEMTAFVSGQIDKATALKEIDASWPK